MHREIVELTQHESLTIAVPPEFKNSKKVIVTIDEYSADLEKKITLLLEAGNDPLFMADLKEVNDDFSAIEHESISAD